MPNDSIAAASAIIAAALPIAEFALKAIAAANAGNIDEAERHLREMRLRWQEGSDAWDAAGD